MASKNLAYRGPEWMLTVAIDDDFRITETMFAKDGSQYDVTRRASLKERLAAAKDASSYYAPKLSTVEHNVTSGSIEKMSDDELKAELEKAMQFLAPKVVDHGKDGKVGSAQALVATAEAAGPDSEGAVGEPDQQTTDSPAEDQEAQSQEAQS